MGCSHSDLMSVTKNVLNPTHLEKNKSENAQLTQEQIDRIQQTWKLVDNQREFGLMIMVRIFTKHHEIKQKWIFAKDLHTEEEICKNPQVVYHATKIIEVFARIISNLHNINTNDFKDVTNLGKNHYDYGVRPGDFEHFEECLFYCLEKKIANDKIFDLKAKGSWKKFFWTIVGKLCEGIYLAEIDELNTINKSTK